MVIFNEFLNSLFEVIWNPFALGELGEHCKLLLKMSSLRINVADDGSQVTNDE